MNRINRRELLGIAAGAAVTGAGFISGCQSSPQYKRYRNEDFYKADGTFDSDKAKQAYYEMMKHFKYPIPPRLRTEEFWALDFGLGKFTEVGMAGIFWVNNKNDNYFGHEIYLLPGQMIPEHAHVKTEDAGPKMEAWQVRHGWVYIYGEGEPTDGVEERIPPSHKLYAVAKKEKKLLPGEIGMLEGAESKHFMVAGLDGVIVTEYATYHDSTGLRFSHPKARL